MNSQYDNIAMLIGIKRLAMSTDWLTEFRVLIHREHARNTQSDLTESMVTKRSPFCGYNTI